VGTQLDRADDRSRGDTTVSDWEMLGWFALVAIGVAERWTRGPAIRRSSRSAAGVVG
jgi:hypothetical protein